MDESNVEFWLNATELLELAEEFGFVGGDRGECGF